MKSTCHRSSCLLEHDARLPSRHGQEDVAGRAARVHGGHGIFLHNSQGHQGESGKVRDTQRACSKNFLSCAQQQHATLDVRYPEVIICTCSHSVHPRRSSQTHADEARPSRECSERGGRVCSLLRIDPDRALGFGGCVVYGARPRVAKTEVARPRAQPEAASWVPEGSRRCEKFELWAGGIVGAPGPPKT